MGILQPPYSWTGNLLEKESALVTLGNYQFINATSYDFKIYTDSPNGIVDCAAYNDTTYLNSIFAGGLTMRHLYHWWSQSRLFKFYRCGICSK